MQQSKFKIEINLFFECLFWGGFILCFGLILVIFVEVWAFGE